MFFFFFVRLKFIERKAKETENLFRYFDAWFEGKNRFCILMEYCEDGSLADVLESRNGRHIKDTLILEWMIQLGMALKYLHDRNVVHRDVKVSFFN